MRAVRRATFLEQAACLQIPVPVLKFFSVVYDGGWLLGGGLAPGGCRVVGAPRISFLLMIFLAVLPANQYVALWWGIMLYSL